MCTFIGIIECMWERESERVSEWLSEWVSEWDTADCLRGCASTWLDERVSVLVNERGTLWVRTAASEAWTNEMKDEWEECVTGWVI